MLIKSPNATDKHVGARVRMRRLMLGMSHESRRGRWPDLPADTEIRKGHQSQRCESITAHREHLAVPVAFFFEGLPQVGSSEEGAAPLPAYIDDFLATSDGLSLTKSFLRIKNPKLRRSIVDLVEHIAARHN
jgi:hypothetical protein